MYYSWRPAVKARLITELTDATISAAVACNRCASVANVVADLSVLLLLLLRTHQLGHCALVTGAVYQLDDLPWRRARTSTEVMTGFENIMIYRKISKISKILWYFRYISDIFDIFEILPLTTSNRLFSCCMHIQIIQYLLIITSHLCLIIIIQNKSFIIDFNDQHHCIKFG